MAIVHESSATAASGTCTKPTGTTSGDVLVAVVSGVNGGSNASLAGWTSRIAINVSAFYTLTILTKVAGGSEPANYTFTGPAVVNSTGISRFSGVDNTTPIDGTPTSSNSSGTAPTLTTTVVNSVLVMAAYAVGGSGITADAAMTERWEEAGLAAGPTNLATELRASAGASGTRTATDGAAAAWLVGMLALKEAGAVVNHPLDGAISGSSAADALRIRLNQPMTGAIAAASASAASRLSLAQPLAGSVSAASAAAADGLKLSYPLAGAVAGSALADAVGLVLANPLAGDLAGDSAVAGVLDAPFHPLTGDLAGTALADALRLVMEQPLLGDLSGDGAASAVTLGLSQPLDGIVSGSSAAAVTGLWPLGRSGPAGVAISVRPSHAGAARLPEQVRVSIAVRGEVQERTA